MKIAILYNFLDNIGGSEILSLTLAKELGADLYTTNIDPEKINKMGFGGVNIKSIGRVPINAPFRHQLTLWRFRRLNLKNKYDFYIISGDWAFSAAVNNKPNLWYVHAPSREIWDLSDYIRDHMMPKAHRPIFYVWVKINRFLTRKYISSVDKIVCNSKNTQERIEKYFGKRVKVINPPIDTSKFRHVQNGGYWLSANRLFTHKRVDMQLRAFLKMPDEKLIIVGSYEQARHFKNYAEYIKKIKPSNVEILHWVNQEKLIDLYANCKGFITTSMGEDFGMTAIEAMASGKPVIAPNEGGYKETVIDGQTGILIDNINEDKIVEAVKKISGNLADYKTACLLQAKRFDKTVFIAKIKDLIDVNESGDIS